MFLAYLWQVVETRANHGLRKLRVFNVLVLKVISPDFPLELTGFFPGRHLNHFLVLKMKDFRNFVLDNRVLDFDAEQIYLKP